MTIIPLGEVFGSWLLLYWETSVWRGFSLPLSGFLTLVCMTLLNYSQMAATLKIRLGSCCAMCICTSRSHPPSSPLPMGRLPDGRPFFLYDAMGYERERERRYWAARGQESYRISRTWALKSDPLRLEESKTMKDCEAMSGSPEIDLKCEPTDSQTLAQPERFRRNAGTVKLYCWKLTL